MQIDETDQALIAALSEDARAPVADLARRLGLRTEGGMEVDNPLSIGNVGRLDDPMSARDFAVHVESVLGREALHIGDGEDEIETLAWCTGAAQGFIEQAQALGVDAYLFGSEPPCDSAPFFTAGIPSVCHISGPLYLFDPHDTIDMVRQEDLPKVAELFYRVIRRIDSIPASDLAKGTTRHRDDPPAAPPPWFLPPEFFLGV